MKYYCQNSQYHNPKGPSEVLQTDELCRNCGKKLAWPLTMEVYAKNQEQWGKTETIAVYPYGMDGFLRKL